MAGSYRTGLKTMVAASAYDTPSFHGYGYQVLKFGTNPTVGIGRPSKGQIQKRLQRFRRKMHNIRSGDRRGPFRRLGLRRPRSKQQRLRALASANGRLRFWKRTLKAYRRYGKARGWMIAKRNYKRWGRPRLPHRQRSQK